MTRNLAVFLTLFLGSCSFFQKEPLEKKDLELFINNAKPIEIVFWGNQEGETKTCSCSLLPLGGINRRKTFVESVQKQNPDAIFLNFGNIANISKKGKLSSSELLNEKELLAFETASGAFVNFNESDRELLLQRNHDLKCESCLSAVGAKAFELQRNLLKITLSSTALFAKMPDSNLKNDLFILANDGLALNTQHFPKEIPDKNMIVLGGSDFAEDSVFCEPLKSTLQCMGSHRGRTVGRLKVYIQKAGLPFKSLYDLKALLSKNEASILALKTIDPADQFTTKDLGRFNYFNIESIYMNSDYGKAEE